MRKFSFIFTLIAGLIGVNALFSQTEEEMKADIPQLKAFHEVIFKMWHEAWPDKNIALFKELIPGIDSHAVKIKKVELPGILRDKKPKWDENVKYLDSIIVDYKKAAEAGDTQKSLDAAEKLHAQYEKLVRTIKPVLKEIDAFHKVLYPLYHYYMPEYNKEKIKSSVAELKVAMDTLDNAVLPERMKTKGKSFEAKRSSLGKAVQYLVKVTAEIDDEKTIKDAINDMHSKYQALEHVFD